MTLDTMTDRRERASVIANAIREHRVFAAQEQRRNPDLADRYRELADRLETYAELAGLEIG